MELALNALSVIGILAIIFGIYVYGIKPSYTKLSSALKARAATKSATALAQQQVALTPALSPVLTRLAALETDVKGLKARVGTV